MISTICHKSNLSQPEFTEIETYNTDHDRLIGEGEQLALEV